ncbi:hypothetical protein Pcinc_026613 [Petrolisthes cinctipes]|uniref:Uncharacterized protein n=1 Tax=Petrolisthes cinctipes TaxID=88211 RepID=A0AAE1F6J6_PETCI|nr:hypothetical protein Pcinc_026613 [Petrolisthes cinctipes]
MKDLGEGIDIEDGGREMGGGGLMVKVEDNTGLVWCQVRVGCVAGTSGTKREIHLIPQLILHLPQRLYF